MDDLLKERLKRLESEVESLKVTASEENHWRKILEEWLLNRFGFDVNLELSRKPLSHFKIPEKETNSGDQPEIEEDLSASIVIQNDELLEDIKMEAESKLPDAEKTNVEDKNKTVAVQSPAVSSVVGGNLNFAPPIVGKPREAEQTKMTTLATIKIATTENAPKDLTEEYITEVPQLSKNTEYHVTLKAKNAIRKLESRENSYECKECKQVFDNLYKAEGHARHHFETKFKCIDCPLYFEVEQDLILHAQVVHYKIRKRLNSFTCYIGGCPWTSKSPDALRHHRTLKHPESKEGNVESSASTSPSSQNISSKDDSEDGKTSDVSKGESDNIITQEQPSKKAELDDLISYKGRSNRENSQWQCKVCEKTFGELSLAKIHVSKTHFTLHFPSNEKKGRHVVCRVCKKAFSNDNWLKRHELAEHRNSVKKYTLL